MPEVSSSTEQLPPLRGFALASKNVKQLLQGARQKLSRQAWAATAHSTTKQEAFLQQAAKTEPEEPIIQPKTNERIPLEGSPGVTLTEFGKLYLMAHPGAKSLIEDFLAIRSRVDVRVTVTDYEKTQRNELYKQVGEVLGEGNEGVVVQLNESSVIVKDANMGMVTYPPFSRSQQVIKDYEAFAAFLHDRKVDASFLRIPDFIAAITIPGNIPKSLPNTEILIRTKAVGMAAEDLLKSGIYQDEEGRNFPLTVGMRREIERRLAEAKALTEAFVRQENNKGREGGSLSDDIGDDFIVQLVKDGDNTRIIFHAIDNILRTRMPTP